MKDSEIIVGVLNGIGRRLWVGRALREAFFGLCVLLFFLIAFRLAGAVQPAGIPAAGIPVWFPVGIAIAALAAGMAWRISRRVTLSQAAAEADARAALNDELKSAYWFVSNPEQSPFIDTQVARAAATAGKLDPRALVPAHAPRSLWAAASLGVVFAFVAWLAPQMTPYRNADAAPAPTPAQEQDLRALLKDAPRDARIEKLERAIDTLERPDATAEQKRQAMETMRDLAEQAGMEALDARDAMARLARSLARDPRMVDVVKALENGKAAEAAALVKEMREGEAVDGQDDPQNPDAGPGLQANRETPTDLDRRGSNLAGNSAAGDARLLDDVVRKIEEAGMKMDAQDRAEQVRRGAEERMSASSRRSSAKANAAGNNIENTEAGNATPAPEGGNTDMSGGAAFNAGKGTREEDADGTQQSRSGSPPGESESQALLGKATERLEAQLQREGVQRDGEPPRDEQGDDEDWIYTGSQQQASSLQYEEVRARGGFDREFAGNHDRIPVRQKQVVKNYFLNLHESEKK